MMLFNEIWTPSKIDGIKFLVEERLEEHVPFPEE